MCDEVIGGQRKQHNEEFRDVSSSPSIIRMIKSMGMRWAGNVARTGEFIGRKTTGKVTTRKTKT
jgi:hypothetical protein